MAKYFVSTRNEDELVESELSSNIPLRCSSNEWNCHSPESRLVRSLRIELTNGYQPFEDNASAITRGKIRANDSCLVEKELQRLLETRCSRKSILYLSFAQETLDE